MSSTALCSVTAVMMWLPFSRYISATPLIARLSVSVAPLVKTISFGVGADQLRDLLARLLDRFLGLPAERWLRLAALPKCSVKYGSIASSTRGSTGVVA